ncbi:MAG: V-type ATP synthase subunit F [archaeon]
MDIAVLGDEDTVLGFSLAGIKDSVVFDESKGREQIESLSEARIILINEAVAHTLREKGELKDIDSVLVEIPDKTGSKGLAMKNISRLFESAIGIKLKKEGE